MKGSIRRYANNFATKNAAESYSTKYQRIWLKQLSDQREALLLERCWRRGKGPFQRVPERPCGVGRLTNGRMPLGEEIIAADYSDEQLKIYQD